jgi:C-terminal processing protease CtpA/Prc
MTRHVPQRSSPVPLGSTALLAALAAASISWGQAPTPSTNPAPARDQAQQKVEAARETKQGARDSIRDARETVRDTGREGRQDRRDTRESARDTVQGARETARDAGREGRQTTRESTRDTVQENRQSIREARRDVRRARREFIASRLRSGDLGLWLRRLAEGQGIAVSDLAGRGAISQSGLKEGDVIVSVNEHPVGSEREFIDYLFGDTTQPAKVVVKRGGQQQTLMIDTKAFIAEHEAGGSRLEDFGLILDESNPSRVKVQAVVPRSPAFYAGVRSGDQITQFNGQRIAALADLVKSIANTANQTASLEVNRNNQTRQLEIDVPDEHEGDGPRTALRPTLPEDGATTAPRPQFDNNTTPQPSPLPAPAPRPQPQPSPPQ